MFRSLLLFLVACTPPANAHVDLSFFKLPKIQSEFNDIYTEDIDPFAPRGLKVSYRSSVVVGIFGGGKQLGSGSGNYFKLGKHRFIITAAHVVDQPDVDILLLEKGGQQTRASVAYYDKQSDIAILIPSERLRYTKAIPFRRDINNEMGEKIYHCGHPASEGWHISEGILTGVRPDTLMANTFVWPGSSGSVVFDESGRVLGVVSAIRVDMVAGIFPQFIEHIVLVSNIKTLDKKTLKEALENVGG
jgi:S1-C subfamily serine protease